MTNKPIDMAEVAHAERKRIDWTAVHIAGDRRPPLKIGSGGAGKYSSPIRRRGDG